MRAVLLTPDAVEREGRAAVRRAGVGARRVTRCGATRGDAGLRECESVRYGLRDGVVGGGCPRPVRRVIDVTVRVVVMTGMRCESAAVRDLLGTDGRDGRDGVQMRPFERGAVNGPREVGNGQQHEPEQEAGPPRLSAHSHTDHELNVID